MNKRNSLLVRAIKLFKKKHLRAEQKFSELLQYTFLPACPYQVSHRMI